MLHKKELMSLMSPQKTPNKDHKAFLVFVISLILFLPVLSVRAQAEGPAPILSSTTPAAAEVAKPEAVLTDDAEKTITLDFKEADINTVLRVMSLKSKVNIVAGPEVQGTVTIRLENVPWEQALKVVLRTYGYVYERDGNIIRVTTRENLAQEPLVTQTFILNYTKASEVMGGVQDILTERGRIKTAERTNMLIITDIPTNLYNISEVIKRLDKQTPAAFIDSKILTTTLGVSENLGIEWKTGGTSNNLGSLSGSARPTLFPFAEDPNTGREIVAESLRNFFPVAATADTLNAVDSRAIPRGTATINNATYSYGALSFSSFSAVLQMLKSRSNTKVVSNPRIVVLNNQTATIHVGDNIPLPTFDTNSTTGRLVVSGFNYDKLKTGVTMEVTPHINSKEEILVELVPAVNSQGANISFNTDLSAPIINETTAKTQVLIQNGQTIAIGGLLTDNAKIDESRVPYLSDVPLLGKLFKSKRQTAGSGNAKVETLFFVTVTIVDSEGQPTGERFKKAQGGIVQTPATAKTASEDKKVENAIPQAPKPDTSELSSAPTSSELDNKKAA